MANPTNMDSGVDFETWNNSDRGAGSDSYTGMQGIDSRDANDDSLQTSEGTWVIVFDQSNYTGNCWQIDEGTYKDNLHDVKIYDSNGNDTGHHWQGTINSFILYKQKPSWFSTDSYVVPTKTELFTPGNGEVLFTEDTDFSGYTGIFTAPYTGGEAAEIPYTSANASSEHMTGVYAINSLAVGSNAWLIIFDDEFANGNFLKVNPNTKPYNDLNTVDRTDLNGDSVGDWNDQIHSFLIYPSEPEFWNTPYPRPYVDFPTLFNLYPYPTNDVSDNKVVYMVEDSTYTIDCPTLAEQSTTQSIPNDYNINDTSDLPTSGWTKYHVHMEHDIGFAWNDTADFDLYFDNAGNLARIENFIWSSQGAFDVPSTVIESVDLIVWYLGTAGALESAGVSEEVADDFVDVFNFVCKAFNKIATIVYTASDNGGQFYFLPVICHTLNRICTTVATPYNKTIYSDPYDPRIGSVMSFGIDNFPSTLNNILANNSVSAWEVKQDLDGGSYPFNQVVEYTYQADSQSYNYRTWYQESSISAELGIFVSCKIDYEISSDGVTDSSKDDHIILLMGFGIPPKGVSTPVLSFAQAIVQFTDGSSANIITPAYNSVKSNTSTQSPNYTSDVINAVYENINSALASVTMADYQQGRKYIAEITKDNMTAISQCMNFGK